MSTKVFDKYVRDRVEEERREKKNRMRELREQFTKLLEEAGVSTRTTYNDFSIKNGKDERFKAIEKTRWFVWNEETFWNLKEVNVCLLITGKGSQFLVNI